MAWTSFTESGGVRGTGYTHDMERVEEMLADHGDGEIDQIVVVWRRYEVSAVDPSTADYTATIANLRAQAQELRAKAKRLDGESQRASENAPGWTVTGRSGRTRAMQRRTDRALDKTIKNAKESMRLNAHANALDAKADNLALGHDDDYFKRLRAYKRAKAKDAARLARAKEAVLPLVNDPSAECHITSAEWARVPRDYKGFAVRQVLSVLPGYRIRTILRGGGLQDVYLTDKKTVPIPSEQQKAGGA